MSDRYTMNLQGKDYRMVAGRVIDFRKAHPNGIIATELMVADNDRILFKATIMVDGGAVLSVAHAEVMRSAVRGQVTPLEKCETKAIGRALGLAGFGTDDINDDEDGEVIADSPLPQKASKQQPPQEQPATSRYDSKPTPKKAVSGGDVFSPTTFTEMKTQAGKPYTLFEDKQAGIKCAVWDATIASEIKGAIGRFMITFTKDATGKYNEYVAHERIPF